MPIKQGKPFIRLPAATYEYARGMVYPGQLRINVPRCLHHVWLHQHPAAGPVCRYP